MGQEDVLTFLTTAVERMFFLMRKSEKKEKTMLHPHMQA